MNSNGSDQGQGLVWAFHIDQLDFASNSFESSKIWWSIIYDFMTYDEHKLQWIHQIHQNTENLPPLCSLCFAVSTSLQRRPYPSTSKAWSPRCRSTRAPWIVSSHEPLRRHDVRQMWCTHVKRDVKHDTWCETRCEVYTIPRVWAMRAMTRLKLSFSRRNIKRIKRIKLPQAIAKVMEGRCDFQRFFQAVCERPKGIRVGRICRGLRCWLQVPPFEELCNGDMWWFGGWNCRLDRHRRRKSKSEVLKQEKGQTCCGKKCFLGESCDNWSTLDLKILKLELHDEFLWKLDLLKTFDEFLWIV